MTVSESLRKLRKNLNCAYHKCEQHKAWNKKRVIAIRKDVESALYWLDDVESKLGKEL